MELCLYMSPVSHMKKGVWSTHLLVKIHNSLVKAGAKTYFYPDLKSLIIMSWCTYQIFDFKFLSFEFF